MELQTYDLKLVAGETCIMPLGDIQWAGKRGPTAKELLREEIQRGLEARAWFLGMGDYIDFLSPSNRARLRSADLYDTAEDVIDDKAMELVQELYEGFLKPTRGKWLGLLEGHHFTQLKDGLTTDQELARMLGCPFLGTSALIRLNFTTGSQRRPYTIFAHHGCGGGGKPGAVANKLEDFAGYWEGVDALFMGHTTKQSGTPIDRAHADWSAGDLNHRRIHLVGTGGFAKSYVRGAKQGRTPRGSYVEQGMMKPAALGAPILRIEHRGKNFTRKATVQV